MSNEDLSKLTLDKNAASKRKPSKKKAVLMILLAVAGVVSAALLGPRLLSPAVEVETTTISMVYPSQSSAVLNASGYVVAQRKAAVASKITGRLVSIAVEEGARIRKGEVVARLEAEDTAAAKDRAEANLRAARANLDQAKAEQSDASAGFRRSMELLEKGYISKLEYDAAYARISRADAAVASAEAGVKAGAHALHEAEVILDYANLRAPFDAVVLTKNADVGDIITPLGAAANAKAAVVTIADMSSLQVEADVSEANIGQVKLGQPCEIQLEALQDTRFRGEVHMIAPTADRTKATIMVKVRFIGHDPRILPEMSAKVAFLVKKPSADDLRARPSVPAGSVINRAGKSFLFLIREGLAVETEVRTGRRYGDMMELLSEIKTDEKIVRKPTDRLKHGSKVKASDK